MFDQLNRPIRVAPNATAGLKAAPLTEPTATAPAPTVKPIARPKNWLFGWSLLVATLSTTYTRAKVNRNSASSAARIAWPPLSDAAENAGGLATYLASHAARKAPTSCAIQYEPRSRISSLPLR